MIPVENRQISCSVFLTGVDPSVLGQVTGDGEGLATFLADIRTFPCVSPHVFLQVTSRRPALTAHCAHIWPLTSVATHVHVEPSKRSEVLRTVGAAVGPFPRVRPQVALQAVSGLETFPTLWTQEATLSGVVHPVGVEASERAVRLVALVTLVRARCVCALVDAELSHSWRGENTKTHTVSMNHDSQ